MHAIDEYDFGKTGVPSITPYIAIRNYAAEAIPPGKGRKVDINLGPLGLPPSMQRKR